jgi:hypothetical protein
VILREELATEAGTDVETPLVVLQDSRSASAAELLAVALQDNGRAKIIGERSFGKGTVQELIGIPDGSLLTLTVARYFSPDDRLRRPRSRTRRQAQQTRWRGRSRSRRPRTARPHRCGPVSAAGQ